MTAAGTDLILARIEAEREMRSTCVIHAPAAGPGVWNSATLQYDPAEPVVSYEGKCKLRYGGTRGRAGEAAGQLYAEQDAVLSLPVDGSGAVGKDHVATITASVDDAALVGRRFKVTAGRAYSNAASRKLPVTETS